VPQDASLALFGIIYRGRATDGEDERVRARQLKEWERDWRSRVWMTYRRGFERLGRTKWQTDAGWGCTLRSAQMMVANALSVHSRGRCWRREIDTQHDDVTRDDEEDVEGAPHTFFASVVNKLRIPEHDRTKDGCDAQLEILRLFADEERAPFSVHRVCETTADWGAPPGRWFEPSVMCRAFEVLISGHELGRELAVYVVSGQEGEGGGVPVLDEDDIRAKSVDSGKALLLFVPVMLGAGRTINARYVSQLRSMLTFEQSVGIVGGRPNSSLYLVGHSDEVFFYLDPHVVQPASSVNSVDVESYYCPTPLHIRGEALDPTLALGFYCRNAAETVDLLARVDALANENATAPVLQTRRGRGDASATPSAANRGIERFHDDEFADWEFV